MLMYFWESVGEVILLMKYLVRRRKLRKLQLGKDFFHFTPDVFIEAILITSVQKPSSDQIFTQVFSFLPCKYHVPVPGSTTKRLIEQFAAAWLPNCPVRTPVQTSFLIAIFVQIRQGRTAA